MYMYTITHTHRKEPRHQTVAPNTHRILDATIMLPVPLNSEDLVRTAPLKATIATLYQKYTKVASLVSYFSVCNAGLPHLLAYQNSDRLE